MKVHKVNADIPDSLTPKSGESEPQYMDRCMADGYMQQNFDVETRRDYCRVLWDENPLRKADTDDGSEVYIFQLRGVIGEEVFTDELRSALDSMPDNGTLEIQLFSEGGSVLMALEMFNILRATNKKTKTKIMGLAASAATFVMLGTDEVVATPSSLLMIHNAWGVSIGSADDHRQAANMQDVVEAPMVAAYAEKMGISKDEVREMLSAETWMTAEEAEAVGLIDGVTEGVNEAMAIAASVKEKSFKNVETYSLSGVPETVSKQILAMQTQTKNDKPMIDSKIIKACGLSATADASEVVKAIQDLRNEVSNLEAKAGEVDTLRADLSDKTDLIGSLQAKVSEAEGTITELRNANRATELKNLVAEIMEEAEAGAMTDENKDKLERRAERVLDEEDEAVAADLKEDAVLFASVNSVEKGKKLDSDEPHLPKASATSDVDPDADYLTQLGAKIKALRNMPEYKDASPEKVRAEAKKLLTVN